MIRIKFQQVKDHVKKHATSEHYDKVVALGTKANGKKDTVTNGKKKEDDGDGSELSQTSDIEPIEDDDEDAKMEEQKESV